jgi:predicted DNA-binding transcriptional regulator AlpA
MSLKAVASKEHIVASIAPPGDGGDRQDGSGTEARGPILTRAEAAQLLRVDMRTVDRLEEDGRFVPRIQLSARRVGYWKADLIAWAATRTAPTKKNAA